LWSPQGLEIVGKFFSPKHSFAIITVVEIHCIPVVMRVVAPKELKGVVPVLLEVPFVFIAIVVVVVLLEIPFAIFFRIGIDINFVVAIALAS